LNILLTNQPCTLLGIKELNENKFKHEIKASFNLQIIEKQSLLFQEQKFLLLQGAL